VDRLAGEEALDFLLEERLGAKPRRLSLRSYVKRRGWLRRLWEIRRKRLAVLHAVGFIAMGAGRLSRRGSGAIEAREINETLRKLRDDGRVGAVVLRLESPGGGAVASELIRAELAALAATKPVVVSMGDVAASGGYLIATAAHAVVAEATTLTGSIGVIGGKMNLSALLDRLGVRRETIAVGDNAGFFSPLRGFTPRERERHRALLVHFYEHRFLPAVAEGRKLSREQADAAGRGRVWTGRQGLGNGLVDRLGGLSEAIDLAREKAGLARERTPVLYVSRRRRLRDLLRRGLGASASAQLLSGLSLARDLLGEDVLMVANRFIRVR
jgi:protease-4